MCGAAGTAWHFAPIPAAGRDGLPEACGPEGLIGDNLAGLGMRAGDQEVLETKRCLVGFSFSHFTLLRAAGLIGRLSRPGVCEALEAFLVLREHKQDSYAAHLETQLLGKLPWE